MTTNIGYKSRIVIMNAFSVLALLQELYHAYVISLCYITMFFAMVLCRKKL